MVAFGVTNAFFSDTETSIDNLFAAGAIDLKIDNTCYYNGLVCRQVLGPDDTPLGYSTWSPTVGRGGDPNGERCSCTWKSKDLEGELFFDLHDLKPGDWEEDTISFEVTNPAWLCGETRVTANNDVSCTDPEQLDENGACEVPGENLGELAENLNFVFWIDDGDNVFEQSEKVIREGNALNVFGAQEKWIKGDSSANGFGSIGPATFYIAKYFCYGALTKAPLTQSTGSPVERGSGFTCDGSALDNQSQTDNLVVDFTFYAEQERHNEGFTCNPPNVTPTKGVSPTPTGTACIPGNATGTQDVAQGVRKDGSAVLANRSVASAATGAPQTTGVDSDPVVTAGSFFSLGFSANQNVGGGSIVLTFANPIIDTVGHYDFQVFEVTGGTYPDEKVKVEASQDGSTWHLIAASATRDELLDLGVTPIDSAGYLRLTDVSDKSLVGFPADADAYDLDAVSTFCGGHPIT